MKRQFHISKSEYMQAHLRGHEAAGRVALRPQATSKGVSALLALTESAVQAVRGIVSSSDLEETGGLRFVAESEGAETNVQVSVVALPGEDDQVIEQEGARLFLEPDAASLLDDKILDARPVEKDKVAFTFTDQSGATG
jgi:iron-sulfur cluster assembly protein